MEGFDVCADSTAFIISVSVMSFLNKLERKGKEGRGNPT